MFSLDNVLDDLWPQARPAPWQKKLLKKLFYEEEFQQFADRHRHLKGLDTVEQVLEYLNIRCAIPAHDLEQIPEYGPLVIIANHPTRHPRRPGAPVCGIPRAPRCQSGHQPHAHPP